ncbi:MAG: nuclear transport factor 2 family protein [Nitrospira sp.]|nr:nuclear transport factor 2 family protein [Nitrospira sp.]
MHEHFAQRLADDWIAAWNRHDLQAILSHYAPDIEFTSPFVSALSADASGTIRGLDRVRTYFRQGLTAYPDLRFELVRVLVGVGSLVLYYRSSVQGLLAAEMMIVNGEGLIQTVRVHYVKE